MNLVEGERILVLGSSRGLGKCLTEQLRELRANVFEMSRKSLTGPNSASVDFSKAETWDSILKQTRQLHPERIIYCAAGGPFGNYANFQWKDHVWALKTTFEFPAFLLHEILRDPIAEMKQFIVIGSSVAEAKADPGAASYAAAKHALKGLVTSLQAEGQMIDLRLLSPGYMQTDLLPRDSAPRLDGRARNPQTIAKLMIQSISDPNLRMLNQSID